MVTLPLPKVISLHQSVLSLLISGDPVVRKTEIKVVKVRHDLLLPVAVPIAGALSVRTNGEMIGAIGGVSLLLISIGAAVIVMVVEIVAVVGDSVVTVVVAMKTVVVVVALKTVVVVVGLEGVRKEMVVTSLLANAGSGKMLVAMKEAPRPLVQHPLVVLAC